MADKVAEAVEAARGFLAESPVRTTSVWQRPDGRWAANAYSERGGFSSSFPSRREADEFVLRITALLR